MNIFVLHENPTIAAQMQCDKHVVKMTLESAQMLSTVHRLLDGDECIGADILYKVAHPKHPCTLWTMESRSNYEWHYNHFVSLCEEYSYRYGKEHLSDVKLRQILSHAPRNIPEGGLTTFRLAMGSNPECLRIKNPIDAYRAFYQTKQDRFVMKWSKRTPPVWFQFKEA